MKAGSANSGGGEVVRVYNTPTNAGSWTSEPLVAGGSGKAPDISHVEFYTCDNQPTKGSIKFIKQTRFGQDEFTFRGNISDIGTFTLDTTGQQDNENERIFSDLTPGLIRIGEDISQNPTGWSFTEVSCTSNLKMMKMTSQQIRLQCLM